LDKAQDWDDKDQPIILNHGQVTPNHTKDVEYQGPGLCHDEEDTIQLQILPSDVAKFSKPTHPNEDCKGGERVEDDLGHIHNKGGLLHVIIVFHKDKVEDEAHYREDEEEYPDEEAFVGPCAVYGVVMGRPHPTSTTGGYLGS